LRLRQRVRAFHQEHERRQWAVVLSSGAPSQQ
jgi:hypothetical protein